MKRLVFSLLLASASYASLPFDSVHVSNGVTLAVKNIDQQGLAPAGVTILVRTERKDTAEFRVTMRAKLSSGSVIITKQKATKYPDTAPGAGWTGVTFPVGKVAEVLSVTVEEEPRRITSDFQ